MPAPKRLHELTARHIPRPHQPLRHQILLAHLAGSEEDIALIKHLLLPKGQRLFGVDVAAELVVWSFPTLVGSGRAVRDGGQRLRLHRGMQGRSSADVTKGQYLMVQIDLALGRQIRTQGLRLQHRHPEQIQQQMIR